MPITATIDSPRNNLFNILQYRLIITLVISPHKSRDREGLSETHEILALITQDSRTHNRLTSTRFPDGISNRLDRPFR
jgi:hypothetical protein